MALAAGINGVSGAQLTVDYSQGFEHGTFADPTASIKSGNIPYYKPPAGSVLDFVNVFWQPSSRFDPSIMSGPRLRIARSGIGHANVLFACAFPSADGTGVPPN